jgi:MFS transporter, DHA2 family, multidrug resistance protein
LLRIQKSLRCRSWDFRPKQRARGPLQGRKAQEIQANYLNTRQYNPKLRFIAGEVTSYNPVETFRPPLSGALLYLLLTAIALAAFLTSLDGFIVNVAIPTIASELGVREDIGTWLITIFSTASTVCVPIAGYLSRHISAYRLFLGSLIVFLLASLMAGLAHNFQVLLLGRLFQGMGAGFLTPVSLALIIHNFPEEKRSIAVGFWGFFVMVGPAMGPMVGGWLATDHWPWMFFLNVPVCLFSLAIVLILLQEEKEALSNEPVDYFGVALLFSWVGLIQVALNRWNIDDWFRSPFITTLFCIAALCFCLFLIWEWFHPNPFVNLTQFTKRTFCLPAFTTGIAMGVLFSSFVLDSLWVQRVLGYTPAWAGLTLSPVGIFPLIFFPLLGRFVKLLDFRIWVLASFSLYALTFYWLSHINLYSSFWSLAFPRLIQGIGFAFFTVPNSLFVVQGVLPSQLTLTISLFSFVRMLFVGFGVSLSITLWIARETFYQSRIIERTDLANPLFTDLLQPFKSWTGSISKSYALGYKTLVNQASTLALADIYALFSWIFVALCFIVLFYPKQAQR